mgnify:CR=1 FL=1
MGEAEHARVQAQAWPDGERLHVCVETVPEPRMTDRQHVHAQLVRTAGDRRQLDATPVATTLQHTPEGQRMFAEFVIDHVTWLGRRIVAQGQVDAAAVQFRLTPGQGSVGLLCFTVVKLA